MTYPNTSNANGIWTLRDTFLARKGNIWPSVLASNLDPFFDYVSLLLSMDGIDASTTFTDKSNNGLTVTANGNAAISTSESKFGQSAAFDGNGDRVSVANNAVLDFGTGDFTVECWVRSILGLASYSLTYAHILGKGNGGGGGTYSLVFYNSKVGWVSNGSVKSGTSTLTNNTWYHFAACRSGSTLRLFVDGVQEYSATDTTDYTSSESFNAGDRKASDPSLNYPLNGYIDDLRITKGFARYTADFTPPTLPFATAAPVQLDPYFENYVSLLMHMDGTAGSQNFIDDGPLSLSVVEDTAVVIASSPAKFEQSADFPNGQYLQLEDNTSPFYFDGPFTVEFWAYWDGTTASYSYMSVLGNHQAVNNQWAIYMRNSPPSYFMFTNNGYSFAYTPTITANEWQHIAITRDSNNTMRAFLNGVSSTAVSSVTPAFYLPNRMYIGWEQTSGRQTFQGYLDEIRITKGICRYSENFTPPTKAFPDTLLTNDLYFDNVSLLLPMDGTNGSTTFADESSNGFTVTANGGAAISTSESKFGGASGYFDGTGDYLTIASSAEFVYGTGDFTWELWARYVAMPANGYLLDHGSNGGTISYNAGVLRYYNLTTGTGSELYTLGWGGLTTGVWYHIAVSRQSGTTKLFLDGVEKRSVSDAHNYGTQGLRICGFGGGGLESNVYIDDFRITKGVARYTASFNPPTRALLNE